MKKILVILGTRPEAIKMAPLVHELRKDMKFETLICSTGQHREMLSQVLEFFGLKPDYNLNLMKTNQSLAELTSSLFVGLNSVLEETNPNLVFVQGDTTTTMVGALSSFYHKKKIAHLEAGLRSNEKFSPYPEEMNRILTSRLADFHFAPTEKAKNNLLKEGIPLKQIFLVGNTVIDALLWGMKKVEHLKPEEIAPELSKIDFSKKVILVTGHRRESFGEPFSNICHAIREICDSEEKNVEVVYPVHLNPNVIQPVYSILSNRKNIHLIEPISYPSMIYLMNKSFLILTDSGGIQEEAPSLRKPVLVMREVTERTEGIDCGVTKLVGTAKEIIVKETLNLLHNKTEYQRMATGNNPYGDGTSSSKIRKILKKIFYRQ